MSFSPTESLYSKIDKLYKREHNSSLVKLYNASMLYLFIRALLMYRFNKSETQPAQAEQYRLEYDHICTVLYNSGLTKRDIFITLSPMLLFFGYILNYMLAIDDSALWAAIHFIVQETVGDFFATNCNVKVLKRVHLFSLHKRVLKEILSLLHLLIRRPHQAQFSKSVQDFNQVPLFQTISRQFKCQVVRFWIAIEVATQVLYVTAFTCVVCLFALLDSYHFTPMNSLILFFDFFFGVYCASIGVKYLLLLIALIVLLAVTLTTELNEADRRLTFSLSRHRHRKLAVLLQLRQIDRFRFEHSGLLVYLRPFNEQVVSPFYFAYILANIAFNAYCIVYIAYFEVQSFMRNFGIAVLFFQCVVPFACSLVLLVLNQAVRLSLGTLESTLFRVTFPSQERQRNGRKLLLSYWKSLLYCEFLKPKHVKFYSMTAGPMGPINSQSLVQFILIYFGFLMFFGSKFIKK